MTFFVFLMRLRKLKLRLDVAMSKRRLWLANWIRLFRCFIELEGARSDGVINNCEEASKREP